MFEYLIYLAINNVLTIDEISQELATKNLTNEQWNKLKLVLDNNAELKKNYEKTILDKQIDLIKTYFPNCKQEDLKHIADDITKYISKKPTTPPVIKDLFEFLVQLCVVKDINNFINKKRRNLLHILLRHGAPFFLVEAYIKQYKNGSDKPDYKNNYPAHYAAKYANLKIVQLLYDNEFRFDRPNYEHELPINLTNSLTIFTYLFNKTAISRTDEYNTFLIFSAAEKGNLKIIKFLEKKMNKTSIEIYNWFNENLLHKLLASKKINSRSIDQETLSRYTETATYLLDSNVSLDTKSSSGTTPKRLILGTNTQRFFGIAPPTKLKKLLDHPRVKNEKIFYDYIPKPIIIPLLIFSLVKVLTDGYKIGKNKFDTTTNEAGNHFGGDQNIREESKDIPGFLIEVFLLITFLSLLFSSVKQMKAFFTSQSENTNQNKPVFK